MNSIPTGRPFSSTDMPSPGVANVTWAEKLMNRNESGAQKKSSAWLPVAPVQRPPDSRECQPQPNSAWIPASAILLIRTAEGCMSVSGNPSGKKGLDGGCIRELKVVAINKANNPPPHIS